MKSIRIASCLAAAALVLGCDQATEPGNSTDTVEPAALKAEHVGFIKESYINGPWYYSCLGETMWERGRIIAYKGRVYSPSGNANRWTWDIEHIGLPPDDPDYFGDEFTLTGLTSGDVYTFEKGTPAGARRHDKQDGFVYHQTSNNFFRSEDGKRIHIQEVLILHCDYDWNCSLEKTTGNCPTSEPI